MKIGLIADMHGDGTGFDAALRILDSQGASQVVCMGDVVDRGPEADNIISVLKERPIPCVRGNHDVTVVANQERWRSAGKTDRLTELGRIVSDDTLDYLRGLPERLTFSWNGIRVLLAHGTPWSDIMTVFPDSRQGVLDQIAARYADTADVIMLGHTHQPMQMRLDRQLILNPGSIYGVTIRDSHTCAVLDLPDLSYQVFDVRNGASVDVPLTERQVSPSQPQ